MPRCKLWVEKDGVVFGAGLLGLLEGVARYGSLVGAAAAMGMSYRAAWGRVRRFERVWGVPLVRARRGGSGGGGMSLTPEAEGLMARYRRWQEEVEETMQKLFRRTFEGEVELRDTEARNKPNGLRL
ncbi:MAG: LysR family transcriptional regulator [Firmicutes bacterium]|nr:LysR family transcriptional regulator [Bacillota bacterium]